MSLFLHVFNILAVKERVTMYTDSFSVKVRSFLPLRTDRIK